MAQINRLYNFTAGTRIQSSQVDAELDQLVAGHNNHDTRIVAAESDITVLEGQVLDLVNGEIPDGTIAYVKLASDVIAAFVNATGDTMTGELILNSGGQSFSLRPGALDHTFMGFYADSDNPSTRSAYFGFPGAGIVDLSLANQIAGASINFSTTGAGVVKANGSQVYTGAYAPYVTGSYTGDGAATRDITLPFTPSAVYLTRRDPGNNVIDPTFMALSVAGSNAQRNATDTVTIGTNKITVYNSANAKTNESGLVYNYIPFR